jgi:branched-chain amino acid transport system ATP-binding protein
VNAILSVTDLSVHFGGVQALSGLNLELKRGEIHGLIGPNGAGKTTAINAFSGMVNYEGRILLNGETLPNSTDQIARRGVGRIFQAATTFSGLTILENVMIGAYREKGVSTIGGVFRTGRTRVKENQRRVHAMEALERVGFDHPLGTPVKSLPYGAHRKLELARALMFQPQVLLLDEPTAGLTSEEVAGVGKLLTDIIQEDNGPECILLVEHNVPFVFSVCDRVTALHGGRAIATGEPSDVRMNSEVIDSYLGVQQDDSQEDAGAVRAREASEALPPALEALGLSSGYGSVEVLRGVDISVAPGEVVLLYGRNGAGKSTLLNCLAGSPKHRSGRLTLGEHDLKRSSVSRRVRLGLSLVPQERGVLATQTVLENLRLGTIGLSLSRSDFKVRLREMLDLFPRLESRLHQLAGTLSGGERQMLALARVLIRRPRVLLLDEPSIGLAPTVVAELQTVVRSIADQGVAVLVSEQNVGWIAPVADRAYLLAEGAVTDIGSAAGLVSRKELAATYLGEAGG